ncbi:alpha-L-fucosidase [Curtobacterium sp. 'Ferrero']|uniref:alpha-L-fucosidase n=1 Tax=Curtobacterium sp. 'Ferrero' TaxID=2033654 RepID=UPI000BC5EA98|nr:alpha-L-fucosidase [Curtobacterium sp. 'Ferrero']PCN48542.1 alpha-L-fucosidase [Curtobacterium sp. 'Ferrero']
MTSDLPRIDPTTLPEPVDVSDNSEALARVSAVVAAGPFEATWESLRRYTPPRWYQDAKFGIFLHWGVYSVPAFRNEWYSRDMYREGTPEFEHHVATYGPQAEFGYKDFIPSFRMEHFDPQAWANLFRRAGAQFVVPVAEHHDGFAMYDTDRSRWSAARMGPQRDVFGDLLQAADDAFMVRGASSHRAEHWFFMNGGARFDSDVLDPRFIDFYGPAQREETAPNERHLEDWLLRTVEVIDKYRPQVLWFDWWIEQPAFEPWLRTLAAYYYNRAAEWGREVVINYKWDAFAEGSAVYDIERGALGGIAPTVWQNDTSVSKSAWCWIEGHDHKSVPDLVAELVDVVSKNGVLLLNVGPKPDGTIAEPEQELLEAIGRWLVVNGEAIYGSRPWTVFGEGPTAVQAGSFVDGEAPAYTHEDVRFTRRIDVTGEYVYAMLLGTPADGVARIRSFGSGANLLGRPVRSVEVLGQDGEAAWTQTAEALEVTVPTDPTPGSGPVVKVWLRPEVRQERHDALHG